MLHMPRAWMCACMWLQRWQNMGQQTAKASSYDTPRERRQYVQAWKKKGGKQSSKKSAKNYGYFSYKMGSLIFSLEMDYFSTSIPDAEVELGQGSSPNCRSHYSSHISPCKHQKSHFDPASNEIWSKAVPVWGVYKLVCLRGFSMTVK